MVCACYLLFQWTYFAIVLGYPLMCLYQADKAKFIEKEVNITSRWNSENTINFYGLKESSQCIIFEFDKYGDDLSKYLQKNENFKDEESKTFFKQIIRDLTKGLKAIH